MAIATTHPTDKHFYAAHAINKYVKANNNYWICKIHENPGQAKVRN